MAHDIQSLVMCVFCGEAMTPSWIIIENRHLISKIVQIHIEGQDEDRKKKFKHLNNISSIQKFINPSKDPIDVLLSCENKWFETAAKELKSKMTSGISFSKLTELTLSVSSLTFEIGWRKRADIYMDQISGVNFKDSSDDVKNELANLCNSLSIRPKDLRKSLPKNTLFIGYKQNNMSTST